MNVFLRIDLLEEPYDDFLVFLDVGLRPSMVGLLLFGLEMVQVRIFMGSEREVESGFLWVLILRGWRAREERKEMEGIE